MKIAALIGSYANVNQNRLKNYGVLTQKQDQFVRSQNVNFKGSEGKISLTDARENVKSLFGDFDDKAVERMIPEDTNQKDLKELCGLISDLKENFSSLQFRNKCTGASVGGASYMPVVRGIPLKKGESIKDFVLGPSEYYRNDEQLPYFYKNYGNVKSLTSLCSRLLDPDESEKWTESL